MEIKKDTFLLNSQILRNELEWIEDKRFSARNWKYKKMG